MAKTIRNIPKQGLYTKWMRTPQYKWKLFAGLSRKEIVTDYDDKPIAGRKEMKYHV